MNEFAQRLLAKLPANSAYVSLRPENRRFLTGITSSNGMVLVCEEKQVFYTDFRYITMANKDIRPGYEVKILEKSFAKTLADEIPASVKNVYFEDTYLSYAEYSAFAEALADRFSLIGDEKALSDLRIVKSEEEIEKIKVAQSFTDKAFAHVCEFIASRWKAGDLTETRIAAEIDYAMKCAGAANPSFDTIVASGANGSKPHAVPSDKPVAAGEFITFDFGAMKDGYCSDTTRTVAVGHVTEEMRRVYDTVLQAQLAGIAAAKAGVPGRDVDGAARDYIKEAGYGDYFGHGFGHGLGIEVHEAPTAAPSYDKPLPAGAVISAEPGIYLPGKLGVRIEDVLILTENGSRNITGLTKELLIL